MHSFHIPVLGLCFTIDSPVKVGRYGITSVVSIIEDKLLEDMRSFHALKSGKMYQPISEKEPDYRAKRITAYLNLLNEILEDQMDALRGQPLGTGSDADKYFQLLPTHSALRLQYHRILSMPAGENRLIQESELKAAMQPGSIDVNIMAKVDNDQYDRSGNKLPEEYSDALSALRGYANSELASSIVFSAGYNPRLYNYTARFSDFFPDDKGMLKKKIILKVSDYRSALVQGKILAKKGLWVSEFRIESGLNCGGHAFATEGLVMGPILEEFKTKRSALRKELHEIRNKALSELGRQQANEPPLQRLSAQGGVGTAEEHEFLLNYYQLDTVGWGSPFLMVPEATNVDEQTLRDLESALPEDFYLSGASPLGVPFNNFRRSSSEAQRKQRIEKKRPGSPCYLKYLSSNTEFTDQPICTASREYQHKKAQQLAVAEGSGESQKLALAEMEEKDCLCEGLTASVRLKNDMYLPHRLSAVAICPGPNLVWFSERFSLKEMAGHIYGRQNLLNRRPRPHMFVNELRLYLDYLKKEVVKSVSAEPKIRKRLLMFRNNLLDAIGYYSSLNPSPKNQEAWLSDLYRLREELAEISVGC